jgi:hypothetical protein
MRTVSCLSYFFLPAGFLLGCTPLGKQPTLEADKCLSDNRECVSASGSGGNGAIAAGASGDLVSNGGGPASGGPVDAGTINSAGSATAGGGGTAASGGGTVAAAGRGGQPSVGPPSGPAVCGNNTVEAGETCDGNCPTVADCPAQKDPCMTNVIEGDPMHCDAACRATTITDCRSNDGCCAAGCNYGNDSDCSKSCGDGVVSAPETCDGDCPLSAHDCDDGDVCTEDKIIGSAVQCNARCSSDMVSNACTTVASGWTLGVLATGSCPSGYSSPQTLKSGLSVSCSDSCSCSRAAQGTCVGTATVTMSSSASASNPCPSTQSFQVDQVSPPSTMPLTCYGTVNSVSASPLTWKCGSADECPGCVPTGTSRPSVDWATERTFCSAASTLTCKDGSVCVATSPSEGLCVMTAGSRTCPAGFPKNQGTFFTGTSGTPVCTCGGCGSSSGTCAQATYNFAQAGTALATITSTGGARTITSDTLEFRATITGNARAASCNDASATQTGSASGSGPMTVCCAL